MFARLQIDRVANQKSVSWSIGTEENDKQQGYIIKSRGSTFERKCSENQRST